MKSIFDMPVHLLIAEDTDITDIPQDEIETARELAKSLPQYDPTYENTGVAHITTTAFTKIPYSTIKGE